jgi:hypothetical protein
MNRLTYQVILAIIADFVWIDFGAKHNKPQALATRFTGAEFGTITSISILATRRPPSAHGTAFKINRLRNRA